MNKEKLEEIFPKVWCRETSAFPDTWMPENPSHGQCLHTAWFARHYLGGTVWQFVIPDQTFIHYINTLAGGEIVDFTAAQLVGIDIDWSTASISELTPKLFESYRRVFVGVQRRHSLFAKRFQQLASIQ